jgi:DNA-binding MarR family transcriptional regulator
MGSSVEIVASAILDVIPVIMRSIRAEMRNHRAAELTVPLFRTLMFLEGHPGVALQVLAGHLGLTSPSAFKIVDGLVAQGLVQRQPAEKDRRKIALHLTPEGQAVLDKARSSTQAGLAERLGALSQEQCETVFQSLQLLSPLFLQAEGHFVHGEKSL